MDIVFYRQWIAQVMQMTLLRMLTQTLRDKTGATAIEYAFIASLISIAGVAAFHTIGGSLSTTFASVASHM
jgi:pilus assembly protein Flp/PilA